MGWRKWIGDAVAVFFLAGPFLLGPIAVAIAVNDNDRGPTLLFSFLLIGLVTLFVSAWRRTPTWHLLIAPGVTTAALAIAAHKWGRDVAAEGESGLTGIARLAVRSFRLCVGYWVGIGCALALLFGFTALIYAVSARSGRALRGGGWRAAALGVTVVGSVAIPLLEWRALRGSPSLDLVQTTWPVGSVVMIAALSVFIAGGAAIAKDDEDGRNRVLLASVYAIASVVCAAFVCGFAELANLSGYEESWGTIAEMASGELAKSKTVFGYALLFAIPVTLAAALVTRPRQFWRSRAFRMSALALAAPAIVLLAVWVRARRATAAIAAIELDTPAGFHSVRARSTVGCDVEPEDVLYIGDRLWVGPADLGSSTQLEIPTDLARVVDTIRHHDHWAIAIDETTPYERVTEFVDAVGYLSCTIRWVVWLPDGSHSRCVEVKSTTGSCSSGAADTILDVTRADTAITIVKTTRDGTALERARTVDIAALATAVREAVADTDPNRATISAATVHASPVTLMRDVMPIYGALTSVTHEVEIDYRAKIVPQLAVSFSPTAVRGALADSEALSNADGLSICRNKLCSGATWKKLVRDDAVRLAAAGNRDEAVKSAFLVLAMDPAGLDGSPLDPSIVAAAKRLHQPKSVLSLESEPPPPAISAVVDANLGEVRRCVAELDLRRTIRADKWRFDFTVDATGIASDFHGYGDLARGHARACLESVFQAMRFQPPEKPVIVHYLLTLGDESENDLGFRLGPGRSVRSLSKLRMGSTQVTGKLPPEVIQRIVRQNFGRFRLCYEDGLRKNPTLQGRISIRFVIDEHGAVATTSSNGSDLPDSTVVQCVARGFSNLSFPEPEGGRVTVVFPIVFSPGD